MSRWMYAWIGVWVAGCGAQPVVVQPGTEQPEEVADSAEGPAPRGNAIAAGSEAADTAPPHRFTPADSGSTFAPYPKAVARVGRAVWREARCFGAVREEPLPVARSPKKSKAAPLTLQGSAGGRGLGGAMGSGAPPSQAPERTVAAPPAPAAEARQRAGGPEAQPAASDAVQPVQLAADAEEYEAWGAAIYLSNDDTMSLSSAQRVLYAIDHFLPVQPEHIRPHELLNYFSFDREPVAPDRTFSVLPAIEQDDLDPSVYHLGLRIASKEMTKAQRRNVALTYVLDRSGSMDAEGRMAYLKRGLLRSVEELKEGDVLNLVVFDHRVCVPVENFLVGRDDLGRLRRLIERITPEGATDLHAGLTTGYAVAQKAYQKGYSNRVVLITDALTNTGVTDAEMIAAVGKYYDDQRIRLSGVGVGRDFNDALLDRLTERGRGAYVFLGSEAEVDAVFGERFVSLIETVAVDVHFRLHLPPSLRMQTFYGEESSVSKEDVQAVHAFANTNQMFLSDVVAKGGVLREQDDIMVTIEFKSPVDERPLVEQYAFRLADVARRDARDVRKARTIMAFIDMVALMAQRPVPEGWEGAPGRWRDPEAAALCADGARQLAALSEPVRDDPEVARVVSLWDKYCARYAAEPVRRPVRRDPSWPSAVEPSR